MALFAPTLSDIEQLAQAAVERLPDLFREHLADVLLKVEEFPDEEVAREMELETPYDLLGLYRGYPVGMNARDMTGAMPAAIFLYRMALLDEWAQGHDSLEAVVTHVLVHEVGHHFGLSDEDMEAIEASL